MVLETNQGLLQTNNIPYSGSANTGAGTWRGLFSNWFNADNVAAEDWMRNEQAADNQLVRDAYMQQVANTFNAEEAAKTRDFNAAEAEKTRDFNATEAEKARQHSSAEAEKNRAYDERMSNSQYQRAIADMKAAGLNPVLAVSHGASFSGGTSGSSPAASAGAASTTPTYSTPGRTSGGYHGVGADSSAASFIGTLLQIGAGLITKGMSLGVTKKIGLAKAQQPIQKIIIKK